MYLNETKVKHRCYKTLQRSIKIISITILEEQNTLQLAEAIHTKHKIWTAILALS